MGWLGSRASSPGASLDFGQMWPQLWTYLHCGASMGLKLKQTDDASFQVGDQDVFCFIPVESFDLGGAGGGAWLRGCLCGP